MPERLNEKRSAADTAVVILAGGLAATVVILTTGVLVNTIRNNGAGLGENATQVLLTCLGGIIALLGSFIGYAFGKRVASDENNGDEHSIVGWTQPIPPPTPPPPPHPPDEEPTKVDWPKRNE